MALTPAADIESGTVEDSARWEPSSCTQPRLHTWLVNGRGVSQRGKKKLIQRVVPWEGPGAGEGSSKGLFPTTPLGQSSSRLGDLDP